MAKLKKADNLDNGRPRRDEVNSKVDEVRHSLAHLLAAAVLKKYPKTKLGIGPTIEDGFYYDFLFPRPISAEDLPELQKTMRELIRADLVFKGKKVSPAGARKTFKDQPFKLDLIKEFVKDKKPLTIYETNSPKTHNLKPKTYFYDLCRGGHVKNTKEINPDGFKLTHLAGAYWRGDEKNKMLTRIYGAAFASKKELEEHLRLQEEAKKRDHRRLGQELDLFVFSELVGPGLPLYTPRGSVTLSQIKDFSRELRREMGYEEVQTPNVNKGQLFKISGHYDKFREDMFRVVSNYSKEEYFLKPMNCPQHTQIYASRPRSYKDLPLKFSDFAMLYRDEKPGELFGLTRLRSFSQDDSHCFCREDQVEREFEILLNAITRAMEAYGLNYYLRFSLRDEKNKSAYLGDNAVWRKSQSILRKLLDKKKIKYVLAPGEAAFYGPKMDLVVKDALGREWQLSTIQLDFNMPNRFGLEYVDEKGRKKQPIMIHSALVGSPERFFGIILEHFAGAFPLWLAPVQAAVLPVGEKFSAYAEIVAGELRAEGIRVEISAADETLGKRIRQAEMQKIPYILVVGEKELAAKSVSVRQRGPSFAKAMAGKQEGEMKLERLAEKLKKEIQDRSL